MPLDDKMLMVEDLSLPELSIYHEYSENQLFHINEPDLGVFIAESPKVIGRALDGGYEPISLLIEKSQLEKEAEPLVKRAITDYQIPVYVADEKTLLQITGYNLTRGVLCAMKRKELPPAELILKGARRVAVLENVINPTNIGAIVRSAVALGMDAVLFNKGCSDPLYRRAARVSMGTIFQTPYTFLPEKREIESLKALGFKSVAMALRNDTKDIDDPELRRQDKLAIFLGAEGEGLLPETISACDFCVKIPMYHGADSLNVAAARAGASKVTMLCLESEKEMPAAKDEVEEAKEEGIEVKNGWGPKEVVVENGHVKAVIFKKCVSVFDSEHRFAPQYDENDTIEIPCENLLLSIGQSVQWGDLLKGTKVELNRNGTAKADALTRQTAEPDIFVGGDVFTGARFAIDAIAGGREGYVSINRFVHEGNRLDLARDRREFIELDKDDIKVETFDNAKRQIPGKKAGVAKDTFDDLRLTLTEEQVKTEAARCLGCGATTVDDNRCIGCGLCTTKCEFDAIHLTRDMPAASTMYRSEDKLKAVGPYAIKRAGKILINKISGDK